MSKEINIKIQDEITVTPKGLFLREVKPFGDRGAMINFKKEHIGKKVVVIVVDKIKKDDKDLNKIIEEMY